MQWTIGRKLYTCIGAVGVATAAMIGGGAYVQREISADVAQLATRTAPAMQDAEELVFIAERVGSALRDGIVAAVQQDRAAIDRDLAAVGELEAEFRRHVAELDAETDVAEVRTLAAECQTIMSDVRAKSGELAPLLRELKVQEASASVVNLEKLVERCQSAANKIADLQAKQLTVAADEAKADERLGMTVLIGMGVAVFATLVVVGVIVRRIIVTLTATVHTLKSSSEQVTVAAAQVSASGQSLSQGATEQAASLEETSASMEQMAATTRKNAESSLQAAQLMVYVDTVVEGSNSALHDMTESMTSIQEASGRVAKIIKTIDEIAFQTNILALNAAVEAARAGEAGLGFAVVADEVRTLAQRAAQAARDTAALIDESIGSAQEGHGKVDVVVASIQAITQSVTQVKVLVNDVSQASRQQSTGVDQVAQAISQMERVTQSTAATAEESAAASEELNAQAEATLGEVARLEMMIMGSHSIGRVSPAPQPVAAYPALGLSRGRTPFVERRSPLSVGARLRARTIRATDDLARTGTDDLD